MHTVRMASMGRPSVLTRISRLYDTMKQMAKGASPLRYDMV